MPNIFSLTQNLTDIYMQLATQFNLKVNEATVSPFHTRITFVYGNKFRVSKPRTEKSFSREFDYLLFMKRSSSLSGNHFNRKIFSAYTKKSFFGLITAAAFAADVAA